MINDKITLSACKQGIATKIHAVQGENKSRTFEINIADNNGQLIDIDQSCTAIFYVVQNNTVQQIPATIKNNKIFITLTSGCVTESGNKSCWIQIIKSDEFELRVDNLILDVQECGIDDSIEASSEFSILIKLIEDAQKVIEESQQAVTDANQAINRINEIIEESTEKITNAVNNATNATKKATDAANLAEDAINRTESVMIETETTRLATEAAKNDAINNANYAKEQGDYAKQQGDYAKREADKNAENAEIINQLIEKGNEIILQVDEIDELSRKTAEQFAVKQVIQGNNLTISDSADYRILENKLFGLSYQATIPTPDSPQGISSLNTKITEIISNKNILKNEFTGTKTINGVTFTLQEDGGIKVKGTKTSSGATLAILGSITSYKNTLLKISKDYKVFSGKNLILTALLTDGKYEYITNTGNIKNKNIGAVLLQTKQIDDGTQIDEVFYPQIEYGTTLTEFIKNEQQKVEFSLTQSMYGIKVSSGGNYTDTYNQQWLCDSIEVYSDGTGKMIQRILKQPLLNLNQYKEDNGNGLQYIGFYINSKGGTGQGFKPLCNRFKEITATTGSEEGIFVNQYSVVLLISKTRANGEEAVKQWLKDNETYVLLGNGKSIETPLTPEQLKLFKDLKSYYPITNVYNLEGAGLEIKYFVDTKTYIDNKFNVLAEQLLNK